MPRPHAPPLPTLTVLALACLLAPCTGCQTRVTRFSVLATREVDVSRLEPAAPGGKPASGSFGIVTFGAVPLSLRGLADEATGRSFGWETNVAVGRALERSPGAVALSDAVLRDTGFSVPFLFGYRSCTIRGRPLVEAPNNSDPARPEVARLEPAD